tara:strand:- start:268 stop:576 length:309 start_codon:yes stop_codon:yes gene_type:complete
VQCKHDFLVSARDYCLDAGTDATARGFFSRCLKMLFKHPTQVCMTYFQHARLSLRLSYIFGSASSKALVHAFLPDIFDTSSTEAVKNAENLMKQSGCKQQQS